jgi:hypothetical protein
MDDAQAAGMKKLTDIVRQTIGARGRYATLKRSFGPAVRTRKASTIAAELYVEDPAEARGLARLADATRAVSERQGDGTSATAILAEALVSQARDASNLSEAVATITSRLRGEAQPVSRGLDRFLMAQACGVSVSLVQAAVEEAAPGHVEWTSNGSPADPKLTVSLGWVGPAALLSPAFMSDALSSRAEFASPLLLQVADDVPIETVLRAMRQAHEQSCAAVFFARSYRPELASLLIQAQYTHGFVSGLGADLDALPEDGRLIYETLGGEVPRVCAFVTPEPPPDRTVCTRLVVARGRLTLEGLADGTPVSMIEMNPDSASFEGLRDVVDSLRAAAKSGVIEGGGRALARVAAAADRSLARALSRPCELLGNDGDPIDAVDIVVGALEEAARVAR